MKRTTQPKHRQLETNIDLIRKIAWSFHWTTNEDWDDLFQEAALAYCEALKTYNPNKGKITTYMWHCISSHLVNYLRLQEKQTGHIQLEEEETEVSFLPNNFIESLSQDAQWVAEMVVGNPSKYLADTPQGARKKIADSIFLERQWSWSKIRSAIQDLRLAFT